MSIASAPFAFWGLPREPIETNEGPICQLRTCVSTAPADLPFVAAQPAPRRKPRDLVVLALPRLSAVPTRLYMVGILRPRI